MLARVYKYPSMRQQDRLPISTYEEALGRLVALRVDDRVSDDAYYLVAQMVADIFWLKDQKVIADAAKAVRAMGVV